MRAAAVAIQLAEAEVAEAVDRLANLAWDGRKRVRSPDLLVGVDELERLERLAQLGLQRAGFELVPGLGLRLGDLIGEQDIDLAVARMLGFLVPVETCARSIRANVPRDVPGVLLWRGDGAWRLSHLSCHARGSG